MHSTDDHSSQPWLVLTATIDPRGMVLTVRSDPRVRLNDYEQSLRQWLHLDAFHTIVFCENSNANLGVLQDLVAQENRKSKSVRFIAFDGNGHPPHLGKGVGEMNILSHLLATLTPPPNKPLVKVTGRYQVPNARQLCDLLAADPLADVVCNFFDFDALMADSRVFAATPEFLRSYLLPLQHTVNDTGGRFFEHALADR